MNASELFNRRNLGQGGLSTAAIAFAYAMIPSIRSDTSAYTMWSQTFIKISMSEI